MDLIVNFTPTGMVPTKAMTPHVPVAVSEIVEDVHAAWDVGITMVHLHARDERTGEPTWRAEVYGAIIEGIRAFAPDLVVCVSLSGRTFPDFEKRSEPLRLEGALKPDMGSLTLGSMNFARQPSINSPEMIQRLAAEMRRLGIVAELEAFDAGMVNYAKFLEKKALLAPPHYFNLLLGNIATAQADHLHLATMVRDLPDGAIWSAAGIGDAQLPMNATAIACGGGVRVGLEDNIWYDSARTRLARNIDLVRRVHALAEVNERSVMQPGTLRALLQLEPGCGRFGRGPRDADVGSGGGRPGERAAGRPDARHEPV
jgi:uncharacterized protein (DUF849 family)